MNKQKSSKGINIGLWVLQVLLAIAFFMAGLMKITSSAEDLAAGGMSVVDHFSLGMIRFIGISEVLAAIGLILPAALRIKPILTVLAAVGVAVVMASATIYHIALGEPFAATAVLLLLALVVVWGRLKKAPIQGK